MTTAALHHLVVLYGTVHEVLTLAPVIKAARDRPDLFKLTTAAVGSPALLAEPIIGAMGVTTDYNLPLSTPPTAAAVSWQQLDHRAAAIAPFLAEQAPQLTLVAGDGWVAAAAGLLGGYGRSDIAHIRAGRRYAWKGKGRAPAVAGPRPWEFHRRLLSAGADLHLAATELSRGNLLRAGVDAAAIFVTGSPLAVAVQDFKDRMMADGALAADLVAGPATRPAAGAASGPAVGIAAGAVPDITAGIVADTPAHRRLVLAVVADDSPDPDRLVEFCQALRTVAAAAADTLIIAETPYQQTLRPLVVRHLGGVPGIKVVAPMTYRRRWHLLAQAYCAVTMGGVLEEEGACFGTPVLIMADGTSWPEMVELGGSRLTGAGGRALASHLQVLLRDPGLRNAMAAVPNPYGDGDAAHRAVQAILQHLDKK